MSDDIELLVSETVKAIPKGQEWPGSVVRWCHLCSEAIWLSREAIRKLEDNPKVRPTCAACAVPILEDQARANGGKVNVHKVDPRGAPLRPVLDYIKREYGQ